MRKPVVTPRLTRVRPGRTLVLLAAAIALIGFLVRFTLMMRGGGPLGIGAYDDGVYYTAAARLLHGDLPYRDYLFLQPPGIVVVLAPIAALAHLVGDPAALTTMRVGFQLLGGLNAALVLLNLTRFGRTAAVTGGLVYAVFYPAAFDERTALLEPVGSTGLLVALLLTGLHRDGALGPRAALLAGVALGVAVDMKVWFIVPGLVILAFARGRLRVAIGAVAAVVVGYLPFFALAPAESFRQIVLDQTGRPRSDGIAHRFESFLGLAGNGTASALPHVTPGSLLPFAAMLLGLAVAIAWRERRARVLIALLAVAVAVLLSSPASYTHYASLVAVPLALVVGAATGAGIAGLRRRPVRIAIAAVVVLAVAALSARNIAHGTEQVVPAAELQTAAAKVHGCVIADDPTILASIDVLTRDIDRGCTIEPDMSGYSFDPAGRPADATEGLSRPRNTVYQAHALHYLRSGAAYLQVRPQVGLSRAVRATLAADPVLARYGTWVLRQGSRP